MGFAKGCYLIKNRKLPRPPAQSCCNCVTQANARRHLRHALLPPQPMVDVRVLSRDGLVSSVSRTLTSTRAYTPRAVPRRTRPGPSDWFLVLYYDYVSVLQSYPLVERTVRRRLEFYGRLGGPVIAAMFAIAASPIRYKL